MEYKTVFDHPIKKNAMQVFGKDPETIDEFAQMCIDTINDKLARSKNNAHVRVVGFCLDLEHSARVSNSHSAPLLGHRHFWGVDGSDTPKSYPGWQGRVWIRYSDDCTGFLGNLFDPTISYTGTGGSGTYDGPWTDIAHSHYISSNKQMKFINEPKCFSWDYRLFDMDFPALADKQLARYNKEYKVYEKLLEVWRAEMTWYKVTEKNHPTSPDTPKEPKLSMQWTEFKTVTNDNAFKALLVKDASRRVLNKSYVTT